MKNINGSKTNIMRYTYGHGYSTNSDFPPEIIKSLSCKSVSHVAYKANPTFVDKMQIEYWAFLRKVKLAPFKFLSLFKNKILMAKDVLSQLESNGDFTFSSHCWVDVMGGTGVWTEAIQQLSSKKTFNIDIQTDAEFLNDGLKLYSGNRIYGNILDLKLDESINAVFIRSGLNDGILANLVKNNPHIKTLVYCPCRYSLDGSEGLETFFDSHKKVSIKRNKSFILDNISNVEFCSKIYSYDFHIFKR